MPADPNPLDYRPQSEAARDAARVARRSLRTWVILGLVWGIGLIVWAVYIVLIVFVALRLLA